MWALACLTCLRALPLGRATLWEHRQSIGKPFDRLHKWCGRERSALAAELRAPTSALCKRWRSLPKPAGQETAPEQKTQRSKVVDMIAQGLLGIGGNSPASPAPSPMMSPGGGHLPAKLVAAEVEAALFGRFGGLTHDYKQHARMLRSNLAHPGNASLRERILSGELSVEELVAMDSAHLAPGKLQEERRAAEIKLMKDSVVQQYLPRLASRGEGSPTRHAFSATAPPVWVKQSDSTGSQEDLSQVHKTFGNAAAKQAHADPPVLEPPPTPFQDGASGAGAGHHGENPHPPATPEILPTPEPLDAEDEQDSLIQYLMKPILA